MEKTLDVSNGRGYFAVYTRCVCPTSVLIVGSCPQQLRHRRRIPRKQSHRKQRRYLTRRRPQARKGIAEAPSQRQRGMCYSCVCHGFIYVGWRVFGAT